MQPSLLSGGQAQRAREGTGVGPLAAMKGTHARRGPCWKG